VARSVEQAVPFVSTRPPPLTTQQRHPGDGWILADPYPVRDTTRRALRGLIRIVCPPVPHLEDLEDRIEIHVRRMLRYMLPVVAFGFVVSVHALDWAPLWRGVAFRRLQRLDRDRAEQLLTQMGESRSGIVRAMILGVRGLVLSTFFDQDEVHRAMDWHPLPFLVERMELRERLLAGASPTVQDSVGGVALGTRK
jgi:hypothetical protein